MNNKILGHFGQKKAKDFLMKKGYSVLEENWTIRGGEIDLVMKKGGKIVFVEVKTRSSESFGTDLDLISHKQLQSLLRVARIYLQRCKKEQAAQFDLVVVKVRREESWKVVDIVHFEDLL